MKKIVFALMFLLLILLGAWCCAEDTEVKTREITVLAFGRKDIRNYTEKPIEMPAEIAEETEIIEEVTEAITEEITEITEETEAIETTGRILTLTATAYCSCEKCCGYWAANRPTDENGNKIVYTATGAIAKPNHTIAVDPSVIPYGTKLLINGIVYVAEDCGGLINGNRIDIYFDDHEEASRFGRRTVTAELVKD